MLDPHTSQGELGIEWAITLTRHSQDWVAIPDLLYISNERLTLEETEDGPCPVPPDLAIEIISPDQAFGTLAEKATDYLQAGVSRVWIVDPQAQSFTIFIPNSLPITYRGDGRRPAFGHRAITDSLFPNLRLIPQDFFQQAGIS